MSDLSFPPIDVDEAPAPVTRREVASEVVDRAEIVKGKPLVQRFAADRKSVV